ncbi:hypothetical protein NBRC116493_05180 [Aurantivibrio infirmus]
MEFWLSFTAIVISLASMFAVPIIIIYLPTDYFTKEERGRLYYFDLHPVFHYVLVIAKNLLGLVLLAIGITLLVLPGQGLLTMLIGLLMMDFPGKYKVTRILVSKKVVHEPINWLRSKFNRDPILLDQDS